MELWSGIISFILFTFTFVSFLVQVVGHEFSKFVSGFFQQGSAWTFVKVNEMSRVSRWEGSLKKEREAGCENLNSLFSSHFLPFPLPSFPLSYLTQDSLPQPLLALKPPLDSQALLIFNAIQRFLGDPAISGKEDIFQKTVPKIKMKIIFFVILLCLSLSQLSKVLISFVPLFFAFFSNSNVLFSSLFFLICF